MAGKMGKFSMDGLLELQKKLNSIQQADVNAVVESCAKEIAARLLREVKARTPVGEYGGGDYECKVRKGPKPQHHSSKAPGRSGGTLRNSWTVGDIVKSGGTYKIDVINTREYASYVEHGHRTPSHTGWVPGHFMLTISEQEIQSIAPKVLEAKVANFLKGVMK